MITSNFTETLSDAVSFDMVNVKGGEFDMGGADEEATDREKPVHRVKVSSFCLGRYPVTQAVWTAVMGNNSSEFKGEQRPVETVSWEGVQEFIKKLNMITGKVYRLLSKSEWEYAARGGNFIKGDGYVYSGSDKLKQVGWYKENSRKETHEVGLKYPNELGIYDMSGNIWEWCQDQWHDNYEGAPDDGAPWVIWEEETDRVVRGGSWNDVSRRCRIASRSSSGPEYRHEYLGFRLALSSN